MGEADRVRWPYDSPPTKSAVDKVERVRRASGLWWTKEVVGSGPGTFEVEGTG